MIIRFKLLAFFLTSICTSNLKAQTTFTGKPQYEVYTTRDGVPLGTFNIELFPLIAPKHVRNFDSLVSAKFYDSTAFHRVIPGFMIQGGDPNSRNKPKSTWGYGDPSQPTVPAEFSAVPHLRGILSAARSADTNSATSQFFICVAAASWLNGQYSVYGKVTSGMNWVDTIVKEPRDGNDNPYKKIEMFITYTGENLSIPNPPALSSPVTNTKNVQTTQLLKWLAAADAALYQIEVSTDSLFNNIFLRKNVGGLSYTITNLSGSTKYFWRIITNNGGRLSDPSEVWSFTTATGAADLAVPANNTTAVSINPTFNWNPVANATSYRLQISKNLNFTSIIYNQGYITDTFHVVTTPLLSNTLYYWRIRSIKDSLEGFYSVKWAFTTEIVTSLQSVTSLEYRLEQNIPNPCFDQTTIPYSIPFKGRVQLSLLDVLGRELNTFINEEKQAGKHAYSLDVSGLSSGIYFYKISAGEFMEVKKLVVER